MSIREVRCHVFAYRPERPVVSSVGVMAQRYTCLIEIVADDGVSGFGESWVNFPAWAVAERQATVSQGVRPLLLGMDEAQVETIHRTLLERLLPIARQWGAPGPIWQAISGVDVALWDIAGKRAGQPLWRLLGGSGGSVPVYASGLGPEVDPRVVEACLDQGIRHFKLKVGRTPEADAREVARLRRLVGPDAIIWIDANQGWPTVEVAQAAIAACAAHGVALVEEPLPADDLEGMARLAACSPVPLAAGENLYGVEAFTRWARRGAMAVAQPDVSKGGGITTAREVAIRLRQQFGLSYAPHYLGGAVGLYASAHLFNAVTGGIAVELDTNPNPLRDQLVVPSPAVSNGCLSLPGGPGLGVAFSSRVWNRYHL